MPATSPEAKARKREKDLERYHRKTAEQKREIVANRKKYVRESTAERKAYAREKWYSRTEDQKQKKREINIQYMRKRANENKDSHLAHRRVLYAHMTPEQKEARRERARRWWVNRTPKSRAATKSQWNRRRARIKGAEGSYSNKEWIDLVDACGHRCAHCGRQEPEIKLTVDHIIPISKGGTNYISNIQPLCGPCNSSKGNRCEGSHGRGREVNA